MLVDAHGRRIEYLRLSVTDRCDLRCRYCMPPDFADYEPPADWLTFDEIERLTRVFIGLGIGRVRLTGGEPLLRGRIAELAARLKRHPGLIDLSLSTNGTRLAELAPALRKSGVDRLNVSLDTLSPRRFAEITGRDALVRVLAGLDAAVQAGFRFIKINMVVQGDTADEEIDGMAGYCAERDFVLRLIEGMPVGDTGRAAGFRDLRPIQRRLRARFGLVDGVVPGGGPARYLTSPDRRFRIGFITPMSQHFCAACNRVRLSVDGTMHLCLGQDAKVDFRSLLRNGASDADIEAALRAGLSAKPERHEFHEVPKRIVRVMAATGG
ncbi:MAG TPA: GTP 3',8-cyclase MoaA [Rhodocyclaceae bacterium]